MGIAGHARHVTLTRARGCAQAGPEIADDGTGPRDAPRLDERSAPPKALLLFEQRLFKHRLIIGIVIWECACEPSIAPLDRLEKRQQL